MPEKPSAKSENEAPGPVTKAVVPSTPSMPRRSATSAGSASPRSGSIGRTAWTAAPSWDGIGGEASPTRAPPAIVVACSTRSPIWASCCWSSAPSPSHSRITGSARLVWKPRCSSVTRVDSALSGRKAAESFSCTSLSPPPSEPSGPARPSQSEGDEGGQHPAGDGGQARHDFP